MPEQKLTHVDMINLRGIEHNVDLVNLLRQQFENAAAASGLVLVSPRRTAMDRYKVVANAEIVLAARAVGIETVWVLEAEWPEGLRPVIPELGVSVASVNESEIGEPSCPIAKAEYYQSAVKRYGSQYEAAAALGVSRSRVKNYLLLLRLHEDILQALQEGRIYESAARTIALTPDTNRQMELYQWYVSQSTKPTIRELEAAIRTLSRGHGDPTATKSLIDRFCDEFSAEHGIQLDYVSTGLGGWSTIKLADQQLASLIYQRLLDFGASVADKVSTRKVGELIKVRFHCPSTTHLQTILSSIGDLV